MIQLPLVGGFNDGKFIEPKGRSIIKMAKPPKLDCSFSHYEHNIGFEFEIYNLETIFIFGKKFNIYVVENMSLQKVVEKLIFGYKRHNKRKNLDLSKF